MSDVGTTRWRATVPPNWIVDEDMWLTRSRRAGDIDIPADACHYGFTTNDEVFVRSGLYALAYDRGAVSLEPANDDDCPDVCPDCGRERCAPGCPSRLP